MKLLVSATRRLIAEFCHLVTALFVIALLNAPAIAQQTTQQGQALPPAIAQSFDQLLATIELDEEEIARLIEISKIG